MTEQEYADTYIADIYEEEHRLIKEAENSNRLVIFVGAGTSIPSGFPSWSQAIDEMRERMDDSKDDANKNEVKNSDDFLKIPQYYYNEHGKNNYVALMRKIFKHQKNLSPHEIHKKILKFRVKYIITTNYDNLLKKAADNNQQLIDVAAQDSDLAYGIADKKIIKMHGDFDHDNFVLKEDDYLSYSEHFRLIETYIKALIAGNVVLFLGYSFSDPDLKQIFTWVKENLGGDQPQSYLVAVGEKFSASKFNYFQNFGIKILYASEKIKTYTTISLEQRLEHMLDFLLTEPKRKYENTIDEVYQLLKPFKHLNYVYNEYIKEIFYKKSIALDFQIAQASSSQTEKYKLLQDISLVINDKLDNFDSKTKKKLIAIVEILGKSGFREMNIELFNDNSEKNVIKLKSKLDPKIEKISTAILDYDIEKLKKFKSENLQYLSANQPLVHLQQAFLSYCLNDYHDAYLNLKKAAVIFYESEVYDWYFLSAVNLKYLSRIISPFNISDKNLVQEIHKETEELNLDNIFQRLPDMGNNHNTYLKDLYTFQIFYRLIRKIYNKARRVKEDANTAFLMYSGIPRFMDLRMQIQDLWYYITSNYLMLDRYLEYTEIFKIYSENILESVLSPDIEGEAYFGIMESPANIRPEKLEIFDLYCILQYLSLKDIQKIISKKKRKFIPIDDELKNYVSRIIVNFKNLELHSSPSQDLFWKTLYIVSNIKFDDSLFSLILSELKNDIYSKDFYSNGSIINLFILSTIRQKTITSDIGDSFFINLDFYLEYLLTNAEKIISYGKGAEINFQAVLFNAIILHNEINKITFSSEKLNSIMNLKYIDTLANIYPLVDAKNQERIKNIALNHNLELNYDNFYHVYLLLKNNIIDIDDELEKSILDYVTNLEDDRKTTHPSKYETALHCITTLYIGNLFKNKEAFSNFIKQNGDDFLAFIISPNNFDYDKFHLRWLKYLPSSFLNELHPNNEILRFIRQKMSQKFQEGYVDETIMKIFFEYFAI